LGTTTAILASDPHAAYNQLVLKYFIAEGLALKHHVYVVSNTGRELVKTCMWVAKDDVDKLSRQEEEEDHEQPSGTGVKIAWRYEGMKKFETTVPSSYAAASK
jgi:elongator complex protein 4